MSTHSRTFVGIGFGPIQSGLFLLEAAKSGNFDRLVVAEVQPEVVAAVQRAEGCFSVNVASADGIQSESVIGLEILNPLDQQDKPQLIAAIAAASEIATALPSIEFYEKGSPCTAEILARGLRHKLSHAELPSAIVYAAENHNHAAERLRDAVQSKLEPAERSQLDRRVKFVNTVIGKMSGVVADPLQIQEQNLAPFVAGANQSILVEQFNRILISQIELDGLERGIRVFEEKSDLLPFEEAKLYGHNAAHSLLGYLANRQGMTFMHEANSTELLEFVMQTFLEESGRPLCRKYAGLDRLFTTEGWSEYVHDLITRMTNPHLRDRVDRVIRDPRRKLGWDDRLIGTMRLALDYGIAPQRYSLGAAAAADLLLMDQPKQIVGSLLYDIWGDSAESLSSRNTIIDYLEQARAQLHTRT